MMRPNVEAIQTAAEKIIPGDWFFAVSVKGEDGHNKIDLALSRGAVAVTTEAGRSVEIPDGIFHEVVEDLRETLFSMAIAKRARLSAKIAVVAGSNGKTTVKEMVVSVLQVSGLKIGFNPENQNTKIGLATTLLRMPTDTEIAVFEVGARHLGDFQIPLAILEPNVVSLLNVGTAHIGEFGSIENLRKEKLSILDAPSADTLIIPADDQMISDYVKAKSQKIVRFTTDKNQYEYEAPASDLNFSASRAICQSLGLLNESIERGLATFSGVPRRFQQIHVGETVLIDDAFNSSPESARAGLQKLADHFADRKLLLVLGSMLELGEDSNRSHRALGEFVKGSEVLKSATLVTIGPEARAIDPESLHFDSVESAFAKVQNILSSFDFVYFKASRSVGFDRLIRRLHD